MRLFSVWLKRASVLTLMSIAAMTLAAMPVAACELPGEVKAMQQQIIGMINAERKARGLPALRASGTLHKSATMHACDMAGARTMAHQVPGGPTFVQRLKKSGYRVRAANENIAMTSSDSVTQVMTMWINSPKHLHNVLDPKVREVGVGIARSGQQLYWATNAGAD